MITVFFEVLCGPVAMKQSPLLSVKAIDVQPWEAVPVEHKMMQKWIDQLVYRVESAIVSVVDPLPTQVVCPSLESLLLPTEQIEGLDEVINRDGKKR